MLKRIIRILSELLTDTGIKRPGQPIVIPLEQRAEIIAYWKRAVYEGLEGVQDLHDMLNGLDDPDDEIYGGMYR